MKKTTFEKTTKLSFHTGQELLTLLNEYIAEFGINNIGTDVEYDWDDLRHIVLRGWREETDEEYATRLSEEAKEKRISELAAKQQRRELYFRLKGEFDASN
jgi:hypothetical protein